MRVMRKTITFVAVFICLFTGNNIVAQQLTLFDIDTTKYPTVKANFFAIDGLEKQIISLTKEDVFIKENAQTQQVVKVVNPVAVAPKQISMVLTIDVSGSMEGEYIRLAKSAATSIVNKLPLDISECAITSFDDVSFINTDFTRDKSKLLQSINTLKPGGGTDYNKGLVKSRSAGLEILEKGMHEKVLIFLTDGYGEVNPENIIQKAKSIDAKIYVITLGMSIPDELKRIVSATNGKFYENIISEQEINAIYLGILYRAQGFTPSSVEWLSTPACGYSKELVFGEKKNNLKQANTYYRAPAKDIIRLTTSTNTVTFNATTKEIPVTVKAVNGDFSIAAFNSSNASFSLASPALPHIIKKNAAETFILKHKGTSAEFIAGRVELTSIGCQSTFIYFQYQPVSDKPAINLIAPDGREIFYVGQDTLIRWNLQNTTAPVKVSFSTNTGNDWTVLADSTRASDFNWQIPNIPGATNLIKVETIPADEGNVGASKIVYDGFTDVMNAYNLSPDGGRYISQTTTELFLYDTYTNKVINKIKNDIRKGYFIFSPDGKYILVYDENKPIKVYNGYTFELVEQWGVFKKTLSNFIEPYISNDLSQYVAKDADGSLGIFNFKTGSKVRSLAFVEGKEVTDFTQKYIVSLEEGDHKIWVWNYRKENKVLELSIPQDRIINAELNDDETVLLVHAWGNDGIHQDITAYDLSGKKLYSFINTIKSFMSLDTYKNFALVSVNDKPALINANTGHVLVTYDLPEPIKFGWFVPFSNGKYMLFTSAASSKVYMLTSGILPPKEGRVEDLSSTVFTILSTKPEVQKIAFPEEYIGNTTDSVFVASIKNNVAIGVPVIQVLIEGADARSFKVLNPITSFQINPKSKQNLEIRFAPAKSGLNQAILKIITLHDTVVTTISGTGVIKPYTLNADELNIGLVEVGKTKDTTFSAVLTNTSTDVLYVTSMNLAGPDKKQFKLLSPETGAIPVGASVEIKLNFKPIARGRTSTQLIMHTKNEVSRVVVPVYAEGHLPRQYMVQFNFTDALSKAYIPATAVCTDLQTKKSIPCKVLDNGKSSLMNVYADRIYVVSITKEGYRQLSDTINLLQAISEDKITREIELMPSGKEMPVTSIVSGTVFDKANHTPTTATISFYNTVTKSLIRKVESAADGTYNISLPAGSYTIQVEKADYLNENSILEISDLTKNQTKDFELMHIEVGETISLPNVYFARGGVTLLESSNESLDQLYTLLSDNPTIRIELLGHTDNQGDPKLNISLSEQRVAAIKEYLVAKGIAAKRISGKGYGGSQPIANNATEETRKLNRRVEFKIISK